MFDATSPALYGTLNRAFSRKAIEIVRGRAAEDVRPYHVAGQALRRSCRSSVEAKWKGLDFRVFGVPPEAASVCSVVKTEGRSLPRIAQMRASPDTDPHRWAGVDPSERSAERQLRSCGGGRPRTSAPTMLSVRR